MSLTKHITLIPAVYQISNSGWVSANALVITEDYVVHEKKKKKNPSWAHALVHVIRLCERILPLPVITRTKADVFNHRLLPAALPRRSSSKRKKKFLKKTKTTKNNKTKEQLNHRKFGLIIYFSSVLVVW